MKIPNSKQQSGLEAKTQASVLFKNSLGTPMWPQVTRRNGIQTVSLGSLVTALNQEVKIH